MNNIPNLNDRYGRNGRGRTSSPLGLVIFFFVLFFIILSLFRNSPQVGTITTQDSPNTNYVVADNNNKESNNNFIPPVVNIPTPFITRAIYYPFSNSNCAGTRLRIGDRAMISFGGGRNAIRSYADTHPSDNKIGYAEQGDFLEIIDGPVCNWNWILWKVKLEKNELIGWTPETNGKDFWIELVTNE